MSKRFQGLIPGIVLLAAAIFPMVLANAQAVSLQEQLAAQYKLVKMGSDTSGYSVVGGAKLLAVQKAGLLGVPYSDNSVQNNKYENGTVKAPNAMLTKGIGFGMKKFGKEQTTKLFAKGDKVYATKIDVSLDKDQVTMGIVACDKCNKLDPPTYNKTNIIFVFPKGSLATASAGQVEDQQQGGDQGGQQAGQQGGQQQPAAQEQPPAEPASIDKGMTTDQVQAAMGKPDKIVNLGTKTIYYYKDMKGIFLS